MTRSSHIERGWTNISLFARQIVIDTEWLLRLSDFKDCVPNHLGEFYLWELSEKNAFLKWEKANICKVIYSPFKKNNNFAMLLSCYFTNLETKDK